MMSPATTAPRPNSRSDEPGRGAEPRRAPATAGRTYRSQPPAQRRAERTARLLAAGAEVFGEHGYAAATIAQVCRAARVSLRTFYEELGTTEELLGRLHDELNAAALDAATDAVAGVATDDLRARARAGVEAYFTTMTADARLARVVTVDTVGVSPAMEARRQAAIDRFVDLLAAEAERLVSQGAIPAGRDLHLTALATIGAIKELIMAWASGSLAGRTVDDVVAEATAVLVAAFARTA